jgi:peptidoglycan/xylan/chitin deacetylase (PgdA/CDA1 family)
MKPSHRRILRWVLGVVAALVLVGTFLVVNVAAQLSGGWDEMFDRSHPMPGDPEVVAARALGAATVDAQLARVVDGVVVPALSDGRVAQPALAGPEAMTDRGVGLDSGCEVGSHNWKRDDPYDLLCSEIRRAIVAGDDASFRADMVALHGALTADGWQPFDEFSGLPVALDRADEDARAAGAERPDSRNFAGTGYRSVDDRFHLQLGFQNFDIYTGLPAPALADGEYAMMVSLSHQSYLE